MGTGWEASAVLQEINSGEMERTSAVLQEINSGEMERSGRGQNRLWREKQQDLLSDKVWNHRY